MLLIFCFCNNVGRSLPYPVLFPLCSNLGERSGRESPILQSARHAHGAQAGSTCRTRGLAILRVPAPPPGGGGSESGAAGRGNSPHPVSRRQPRGDRRRPGPSAARTRVRRPSFVSPGPPPSPAQRGGGSATAVPVARGSRPKPGTIGGGAQSPPCPPPSPPRSPPHRNMAARTPLPPSRPAPPAPRSRGHGERGRLHAAGDAGSRLPPAGCSRGSWEPRPGAAHAG